MPLLKRDSDAPRLPFCIFTKKAASPTACSPTVDSFHLLMRQNSSAAATAKAAKSSSNSGMGEDKQTADSGSTGRG